VDNVDINVDIGGQCGHSLVDNVDIHVDIGGQCGHSGGH
jgi:hypothetical protein